MSEQPALLDRGIGQTGDDLDRFYTPQALADLIVQELEVEEPRVVVEPSVGGGAFARAVRKRWPNTTIMGVDIDPQAAGRHDCDTFTAGDWLTLPWADSSCGLIIGNPPFTGVTAIPHVERCLRVAGVVALILPWAILGGVQAWDGVLVTGAPTDARPIVPRPWPKSVRETALYVWHTHMVQNRSTLVRRLPRWK